MSAHTLPNARREPRIDARIRAVVIRGRACTEGETLNLSFRGMYMSTTSPAALRSLIRLRLSLPSQDIETHAMVVHVTTEGLADEARPAGIGVQFWGLSGPAREAWDAFVRDLHQARRSTSVALKAAEPASGPLRT